MEQLLISRLNVTSLVHYTYGIVQIKLEANTYMHTSKVSSTYCCSRHDIICLFNKTNLCRFKSAVTFCQDRHVFVSPTLVEFVQGDKDVTRLHRQRERKRKGQND